jgi:dienelactone hydrolase
MFRGLGVFVLSLLPISVALAQDPDAAKQLRDLDANIFSSETAKERHLAEMVQRDQRARVHNAIARDAKLFDALKTRADWEKYAAARLQALRESLGPYAPPKAIAPTVTRTLEGNGYRIQNVVFESRPGLMVTANLYSPAKQPAAAMPGILIIHGFHQPKSQAELQDMGVNWAKLGCTVLVPDQLCHGERRQHPFISEKSYDGKFNLPRQDYYSRANAGAQLLISGESLMGWMVGDALRCIDVLLARPGVDKERIIVLGAVAAGGDTAAVTAALDPRVAAVVPFNFGGPEPETTYPLPAEAEQAFPYSVGGHWDSTRRLRNSARDGLWPWVIVGAAAPRRLIYAHEFVWDREHDPVWLRLEKIYKWYDASDHMAFAHGSGTLFGKPEGTGCANIGPVHRKEIYPMFQRWFGMAAPEKEVQQRRPAEDLLCLTAEATKTMKPRFVNEIAADLAAERLAAARKRLAALPPDERRARLRTDWTRLLGPVDPPNKSVVVEQRRDRLANVTVERLALETEKGIVVPMLLLLPPRKGDEKLPLVVGLAHEGKGSFLKHRAESIAELLKGGVAVCLPDVRGTGETRPAGDRRGAPAGRLATVLETSPGTILANEDLMLGQTLLGDRLRDLRALLRYLRTRPDLDAGRLALWGDSFSPNNAANSKLEVPWDAEKLPRQSEPLGGLLALFGALFEDDVRAVSIAGSLISYQSLLESLFCYTPHDVLAAGAVTAGDLPEVAAVLAPRPLRLERLVDGLNRPVTAALLARTLEQVQGTYGAAGAKDRLVLEATDKPESAVAKWLLKELKN